MDQDVKLTVRKAKTYVRGGGGTALLIFLFFFAIMLCAPKSYDDFEFTKVAESGVAASVDFSLGYGNGRILGNLGAVLLQGSQVCAALVKAFVLTGLTVLIPAVLGLKSGTALGISFLAIAGMEPALFAQTITWTSGFQNYVPPVFLSLLAVYLLQRYPENPGKPLVKGLFCLALLVLGAACQLFVEHSAVLHVALVLLLLTKALADKTHRSLVPAVLFFLGVLAGTGILIWIPRAFARQSSHTAGYRSIHIESLGALVFCCARNFLRLSNQYCGLLGIPLCLGAWFAVKRTEGSWSDRWNHRLGALCAVSGGFLLLSRTLDTNGWHGEMALVQYGLSTAVVLLPLGIWILAVFAEKDALRRNRQLTLLGIALFALAPALVVTPIGYRLQLHSYIFLVLACIHGGEGVLSEPARNWGKRAVPVAALLLATVLGLSFFSIHAMDVARNQHIRRELDNGAEEIFIFRFPYAYVHDERDPCLGMYFYREQPQDVEFPVLPFDIWQDQYGQ